MGLFDRISRLMRANLNDMLSKAEDPEKILEKAIIDMQEDLVQLRQAVASAIASQKRSQQQYNQNQSQANQWQSRAQLALQKGDENLAREALQRKKSYLETANTIKATLDQQTGQVDTLSPHSSDHGFKRHEWGFQSQIQSLFSPRKYIELCPHVVQQ
jgi:phage shock protein A